MFASSSRTGRYFQLLSPNKVRKLVAAVRQTQLIEHLESRVFLSVTIVAQGNNAFYGSPSFATSGASEVAGYVGAAQNGSFTGESRAALGTSIGEAFALSTATDITDFELNENGGAGTANGGYANFTVTFGTLSTSSGAFTATSIQTARAVGSQTVSSGGTANTFEDFQFSSPIPVQASVAGTEYGFVIGENSAQDSTDDGGATLNNYNTTSQGYAGANATVTGDESINNGTGTSGTVLNFVVGGTTYTGAQIPNPPTNPAATPSNGQVTLTWTGSSGATSYDVYRSTTSGSGYTLQPTTTTNSYTDSSVSNGTTYYYVITAVNSAGQSGYSTQVSATPTAPGSSSATIVAQSNGAFFGSPTFATSGASEVAGYVGAAQNGSFTGESRAALGTSIGEAFSLSSATNITDFELNESGTAGTAIGGYVNFIVTFGTLSTSSGVFTPSVTENARAVGSHTANSGGPANTFEDFQLGTPISVQASASGTEYGFVIGENSAQDSTDDGGATLNGNNTTNQGYAGGLVASGNYESINNGAGDAGTSLNFLVGGTANSGTQIPNPPTNPAATPGNGQVTLSWTGSSGATSYDVYRSTTSGSGYTLQPTTTTNSYTDSSVSNGTTYYYVITAVNSAGQSGYSTQVSAAPTAPGSSSATIVAQSNGAFYGSPTFATAGASEVAGYVGAAQNGSFTGESRAALGTSIGEAFSLSSATNITDFELNESGTAGTAIGGYVNFIVTFGTLSTSSGTFTPTITENARAVGSQTANSGGPANTFEDFQLGTPISVQASASGTEYGFVIGVNSAQDSTDDGGATLNGNNTTNQGYAGGLVASGNYESINNGAGDAGTSLNFLVGGTTNNGTQIPNPPTDPAATPGNGQVTLTWTASSGATSYDVYRSTNSGSGYTLQPTTTTNSYTDSSVSNGTTYYYVITAVNSAGQSGYSMQVSATPTSGGGGGSRNYGSIMFLGDSITVGADGSNSGYRGFLLQDFNPVPYVDGQPNPQPGESTLTTVGTSEQMDSAYITATLGTPGYTNRYGNHEGHSGAVITDLYNSSTGSGFVPTSFADGNLPNYIYLMIGTNNDMSTTAAQNTNAANELALISYIKTNDPNFIHMYVEPPPSFPSQSMGQGANGYDQYAALLQTDLSASPYSSYVTYVNSRPELTDSDFTLENGAYTHPNDSGYQILATDFFNATNSYLGY